MTGADRDFFLKFTWSLASSFEISNMYVGLEDGVFMGNNEDALYREPGNSGYNASEGFVPEDKVKNLNSCVDEKGVEIPCIMKAGRSYIKCQDDCVLEPCLDEDSQKNCTALFEQDLEGRAECESKIKWGEKYTIETSKEGQLLGFVPFTGYCANIFGDVTETSGEVRKDFNGAVGDCFFEDGQTKVNRSSLPGDFEYCGGDGEICDDTFLGGYKSIDYDPRWRPWYINTKKYQQSMWGNPYPNYSDLQMSITYTTPIYSLEGKKNVFKGVLAVDYSLEFISSFLLETYGNSDINVIIFEDSDPYYLIASSTGINPTTIALSSDRNIPCPKGQFDDCESFRITALELGKSRVGDDTTKATNEDEIGKINSDVNDINEILTTAFILQKDAGFRQDELVVIKSSDHSSGPLAYFSQTHVFEQAGINLKWNVLIVMPMDIASVSY